MKVLDHGYVDFVEAWGTGKAGVRSTGAAVEQHDYECGIIEAARQSTQGAFRGWETDKALLERLYTKNHATPFEFAGLVLEIQAPIFVFREWQRHRTQSYNEMSARYAPLPDLYYEPDTYIVHERAAEAQRTNNKQAGSTGSYHARAIDDWMMKLSYFYESAELLYESALKSGVPKELARLSMPVGHYSRMRCHANLRNWLAFLTLRMDPDAQWEIRQYANAVGTHIHSCFPNTWGLFEARKGAST